MGRFCVHTRKWATGTRGNVPKVVGRFYHQGGVETGLGAKFKRTDAN